jgi:hypothetical protein
MTEQTETRVEAFGPFVCAWSECEEPAPARGGLCERHGEMWDATSDAETWNMVAETVEALGRAMHVGLGLDQLDETLEEATNRARAKASSYEAEAEWIEREIAQGRA